MKTIKMLITCVVVVAVLFASTFYVGAIGFEAEQAYESVFVIYSGTSLGSGFAIGSNCIITNAHVIDNPRSITVATYGGQEYRATVLGIDEYADIAVLVVADATFPILEVADLSQMKTGDDIYAIGAPKGMAYTLTKGGISAKERQVANQSYIQIDAPINEGNSGGPLLNDAGRVLGVNTLKMSDSEGIGLAIPITRVCDYLAQLGVELDKNGNVVGTVSGQGGNELLPERPDQEQNNEQRIIYRDKSGDPALTYAACAVAVLSVAGNLALIYLYKAEKKRRIAAQMVAMATPPANPYDPSERTDFDIEILE